RFIVERLPLTGKAFFFSGMEQDGVYLRWLTMIHMLKQKYLVEMLLLVMLLSAAVYARTRLPEPSQVVKAERDFRR
ncbi:MAG: hypothetical protein JWO78_2278, partial [Micavibrio sp.]|nr:hypothetical protein [Micavibrio sp.]